MKSDNIRVSGRKINSKLAKPVCPPPGDPVTNQSSLHNRRMIGNIGMLNIGSTCRKVIVITVKYIPSLIFPESADESSNHCSKNPETAGIDMTASTVNKILTVNITIFNIFFKFSGFSFSPDIKPSRKVRTFASRCSLFCCLISFRFSLSCFLSALFISLHLFCNFVYMVYLVIPLVRI